MRHFTPTEKCGLLADHLDKKLSSQPHPSRLQKQLPPNTEAHIQTLPGTRRPPDYASKLPPRPAPYKKKVVGSFEPFSATEVYRAIHSLSKSKAAGPDGYTAEVYQNLPGILQPLQDLFNAIMSTGHIPLPMLKLHIAPLGKPTRDPEACGSKRPISLLDALSKMLETLVLARMVAGAEMRLDGRQYAYRPHRGTETHLTKLHDFVRDAQNQRHPIYIPAVDVDSAFDPAPHGALVTTVEDRNVDPDICRYIHNWLVFRIFSVRLASPKGRFFSNWRPIGRGVPQGGVLSPYLWLLHIDKLFAGVERRREMLTTDLPLTPANFLDSLYADDILRAIAHPNLEHHMR